jgi:hypothetical protein
VRAAASLNLGYFLNISMNFLRMYSYTVNNSQCVQDRNANGSVAMHVAVKMKKMKVMVGICCTVSLEHQD